MPQLSPARSPEAAGKQLVLKYTSQKGEAGGGSCEAIERVNGFGYSSSALHCSTEHLDDIMNVAMIFKVFPLDDLMDALPRECGSSTLSSIYRT